MMLAKDQRLTFTLVVWPTGKPLSKTPPLAQASLRNVSIWPLFLLPGAAGWNVVNGFCLLFFSWRDSVCEQPFIIAFFFSFFSFFSFFFFFFQRRIRRQAIGFVPLGKATVERPCIWLRFPKSGGATTTGRGDCGGASSSQLLWSASTCRQVVW